MFLSSLLHYQSEFLVLKHTNKGYLVNVNIKTKKNHHPTKTPKILKPKKHINPFVPTPKSSLTLLKILDSMDPQCNHTNQWLKFLLVFLNSTHNISRNRFGSERNDETDPITVESKVEDEAKKRRAHRRPS